MSIVSEAGRVALRFPFVLLSAVVATSGGFAYLDRAPDDGVRLRLIQIGTLGLPLFIALGILGERWSWGRIRGVAISLAGVS